MRRFKSNQIRKVESIQTGATITHNLAVAGIPTDTDVTLITRLSPDVLPALALIINDPNIDFTITYKEPKKNGTDTFFTAVYDGRIEFYPTTARLT